MPTEPAESDESGPLIAGYAGSDWVEASLKREISPLGREVADILGRVYRGIYHLEDAVDVDWSDDRCIEVHPHGTLATTDFDHLTQLVILAHERAVRIEVVAHDVGCEYDPETAETTVVHRRPSLDELESWDDEALYRYHRAQLCLLFHKRTRGGGYAERHPTMEEAMEAVR